MGFLGLSRKVGQSIFVIKNGIILGRIKHTRRKNQLDGLVWLSLAFTPDIKIVRDEILIHGIIEGEYKWPMFQPMAVNDARVHEVALNFVRSHSLKCKLDRHGLREFYHIACQDTNAKPKSFANYYYIAMAIKELGLTSLF